ncbi:MAG: TonB-dependent receptor [Bacteroidales bacterium]
MTFRFLLVPFLWMMAFTLRAQHQDVLISENFHDLPLITVIETLERNYPLQFFFDQNTLEGKVIDADFQETPLTLCLETILTGEGLGFYISPQNQVSIFTGASLKGLFPEEPQVEVIHKKSVPEEKISREILKRLGYQMVNIGTPGRNTSGYATVSGTLTSFETGQPVAGANIYVADTRKGVISSNSGYYEIQLPLGNQTLSFSSLDMHATNRIINLYSDGRLDVVLETKYNLLEDVVVIGRGQGNLGQVHLGVEEINISLLKSAPAFFGEPDVIKSLLNLPGVQSVGEGTAGYNVRGGKTDQNLILMDQAPIYYPSHFFGNFSAINNDIISNATLYKGSIPVRYGGRISSVLDIITKDGDPEKFSGSGGISPVSTHLQVDGPFFTNNSSFLVSFRTTYSNWLLDFINVPSLYNSEVSFYDAQAKLNLPLNEKNKLLVNYYKSNDQFQLNSDSTYAYDNQIISVSWKHQIVQKMNSELSFISSNFRYSISDESDINLASLLTHRLNHTGLKANLEYFTRHGLKIEFGGDAILYTVNPGEREAGEFSNVIPIDSEDERAVEFGIYAGNEFFLTDRLKIEAGLRLSGLFSLSDGKSYQYAPGLPLNVDHIVDTVMTGKNSLEKFYIQPEYRLSGNYTVNRFSSVKLSYNKTVQYIHMLTNTTAISPTDTWKLSDVYLAPQTGHQVSAGYFRNFMNHSFQTSVELFYKKIHHMKEYKAGANLILNDHIETEIIDGEGKSYGAEFSIKKPGGRVNGHIDYTWSRTLIKSVTDFPEELINDGEYFPANYDKPHNLTVLANLKASRRFIFSTTLNYSTGRPITYPVAKYQLGDQVILYYSKYNQYRIPDYFRIDMSLTIDGNLKKKKLFHSTFVFSIYNLTARKNAYSVYFRSEGGKFEAYQLSIFGTMIPTVSYNFRF